MNDLTKQLEASMLQYSGLIGENIAAALEDVGKQAASRLRSESPKRTGKYRRGWTVIVEKKAGNVSVTVHNKQYRLTHLLEHGHKTRNGGRVSGQPHIAPVEEWAEHEAMKAIEKAVKG